MNEMYRHEGEGAARGDGGQAGKQGCAWRDFGMAEQRGPAFGRNMALSVAFWALVCCGLAYGWYWLGWVYGG